MKDSAPASVTSTAATYAGARNLQLKATELKAHTVIMISDTLYYVCTFRVARTYLAQGYREI